MRNRLRASRRPEVLPVNGDAESIARNAGANNEMLDQLQTLVMLNEPTGEIERGEHLAGAEMIVRLREEPGVREPTR